MPRRALHRFILPLLAVPLLAAADRPVTSPTRDVDVIYRVTRPGQPQALQQRVRWDVAGGRQRVDPPTAGLHIIVDLRAHRLASVRDAEKLVLQVDGIAAPVQPGGIAAGYRRRGTAHVAGLACNIWQPAPGPAEPMLCFTADGVLLRVEAGGAVVAEAISVRYGPSDPDVFTIPSDYRRITTPAAAPAQEEASP